MTLGMNCVCGVKRFFFPEDALRCRPVPFTSHGMSYEVTSQRLSSVRLSLLAGQRCVHSYPCHRWWQVSQKRPERDSVAHPGIVDIMVAQSLLTCDCLFWPSTKSLGGTPGQ